jgi:hypothetical protein
VRSGNAGGAALRVALYYAPAVDDPLFALSSSWLGRDPQTNAACPQPALANIADLTGEPRQYGFHATLKPPMRLVPGTSWDALLDEIHGVAVSVPAFELPALAVADVFGFLALRETVPSPELQALSDACVAGIDRFRAPPPQAELHRRRRHALTPAQEANLGRWGYPYVFATWFFHMTLTRRLSAGERAVVLPAAEAYFAGALAMKRWVTEICLFVQPAEDAPFTIAERVALRG